MQEVSQNEINEWLTYPVTRAYKKAVYNRIEEVKQSLLSVDAEVLKFQQGYAAAMQDILDFLSEGSV